MIPVIRDMLYAIVSNLPVILLGIGAFFVCLAGLIFMFSLLMRLFIKGSWWIARKAFTSGKVASATLTTHIKQLPSNAMRLLRD